MARQARPSQHAVDARLAVREALAGLASPDLQQQSAFAAEALLRDADGPLLDFFLREALRVADCQAGSVRRLRYRLAARALEALSKAPGEGASLLAVRDLLIARVGLEDHGAAATELAALAGQLAAACIDAYCRGRYAALGQASKEGLPPAWLSELLLAPLLRAACRGPARTRVANACLMAHGVLREMRRWARSAGVLHAAVDCLKQVLKLTASGALALCAGEALLPVQGCVACLGPRLKAAALQGILRLCTQAMQRGEWQVRKAAADTMAGLCDTLLTAAAAAGTAAAGAQCSRQQHQQQGLAALQGVAPAIAAAVEQHLKYDRIPQVRQAAAALLQLLQRVPGMQPQEQRWPAQQLRPGGPAAGDSTAAEVHQAAQGPHAALREAAAHGAQAPVLNQPGASRGDLKALITERRRQLQASGEQAAAAAIKAWRFGSGSGDLGKPELLLGSGGSSTGSAGERPGIPAWEDSRGAQQPASATQAAEQAAAGIAGRTQAAAAAPATQATGAAGGGSRPPSAEAFAVATAALGCLASPEQQQRAVPAAAPGRRRGWASGPASPAKQGSPARQSRADVPVQVFVARSPPPVGHAGLTGDAEQGETAEAGASHVDRVAHSVWRENPLAELALELAGTEEEEQGAAAAAAAQPAAALAVPCMHHVQTPQFRLRLQAAPPAVELSLADGSQAATLRSVRLWAGQDGADVGIEFALAAPPGSGAQATLHHYWVKHGLLHQRDSGPAAAGSDQPAPHTTPAARAGMDDLPLSRAAVEQQSLVAGVPSLPPTQHARPSTAGAASPPRAGMAAAPAELPAESPLASLATAALPSFSPDKPPQTQVLAAAAAADDALTPLPAVAAAGSAPRAARAAQRSSAGSPPAGGLQRSSTAATRWATSLRPPGEQLLPGLPDWDRSRPSSPNTGGGSSRSRSPTRYDGSTPGSPGSRRSSRAASPAGQSPLPGEARHCRQQQHAAPQPQPRQRPPSPQRGVSPPSQRPQQQEAEAAASSGPGPGPLTSMVVKAVSKLQQLQELEEELALPGGAGAGQRLPPGAAPRRRGPWQPSLRRSLEPALGAIQEAASDDDGRGSGSGGSGSRRRARSPMCSAELGRLQHLQEQLQGNMLEIQQRLDEQQGPSPAAAAASSSSSAGAGTLGSSEGMPAAWDAQDELPGAGFEHGYAPCRHHWGQHNDVLPASTAWQAAAAATSSLSDVEELSSAESLPQQQHSAGSAGVVMAVSNPLFGSSRPGNAESVPGAPGAPGALPPKRCLVVGQRRSPSESEAGGGGGASWPRQRQRRRSPEPSAGPLPSLGSLGSGFSALRQDFEAEVQQFLRGSLSAAPESHQRMQQVPSPLQQQQQAAAPLAAPAQKAPGRYPAVHSRRASGQATEEGSLVQAGISPAGSSCGAEAASPQPEAGGARVTRLLGSLDLAAILESRPASPAKLAPVGFSSEDGEDGEGGPWQTARSGGRDDADSGPDGWQTARSVAAEGWATAREHKRQLGIGERGDRALRSSNSEEWQSELARATEPAARQCLLASPDAQQQQPVQALRQQQRRQQGRGSGPTGDSDPAVADLQLLRITPRSTSPGRAAGSRGGSSHGSLAEVVQQTFPAQAVERLQALKAQLSPESQRRKHQQQRRQQGNEFASAHSYAGDSSQQGKGCASVSYADDSSQQASPGQQQQRQQQQQRVPHRTGGASVASSSTSGSLGGPPRERQLQPASRDSSAGTQQEGSSATGAPLAPRQASPELPGLGISRRQARLLQSAVGRMAGNPGEGADAADIQEALQDALVAQTAHVQAHYRQAAEARLAELRRHQAGDAPAQAAAALQREAAALQAAQEAATRRELESFVAEVLPRLADILSSRPKLLRCFEAAAEGADEGGADGSGVEDGSV